MTVEESLQDDLHRRLLADARQCRGQIGDGEGDGDGDVGGEGERDVELPESNTDSFFLNDQPTEVNDGQLTG